MHKLTNLLGRKIYKDLTHQHEQLAVNSIDSHFALKSAKIHKATGKAQISQQPGNTWAI